MELLSMLPSFGTSIFQYVFGFAFVLMIIVFVHEMGHFLVARWCNVRVDVFSVGFGRELLGYTDKKQTRWKLCLIPLGGYVKFWGDSGAASFADNKTLEKMSEADKKTCFQTKPLWQKSAIVVAGPLANFIFAIAIFTIFFMSYGQPDITPRVDNVVEGGAAQAAGIQKGDVITEFAGNKITQFSDLRRYVMFSPNKQQEIKLIRKTQTITLSITPKAIVIKDKYGNSQTLGQIGIIRNSPTETEFKTQGLFSAIGSASNEVWFIVKQTLITIKDLFIGQGDIKQLGGPVKIAEYSGQLAAEGLMPLIRLAALLSVGIGLFNLFPIPMLDGGHLTFYLIESIIGKPIPAIYMEYAMRVGVTLLLGFFLFVTFNDVGTIIEKLT